MLGACKTLETPPIVSNDFCLIAKRITFAVVPRLEREAALAEGRAVRDDGNKADSDATVGEIGEHNARWRALCHSADP